MPTICEKCKKPTADEETPVTCRLCNAYFHPACVESKDGKVDDCVRCIMIASGESSKNSQLVDNKVATVIQITDNNNSQVAKGASTNKPPEGEKEGDKKLELSLKEDNKNEKRSQNQEPVGGAQKTADKQIEKKSVSSKSKRSSRSSKRIAKELEFLEERQQLAMDLLAQKEKLLEEKIALNNAYMEQKAKLLEEIDESEGECQSATSSERGKQKVKLWLKSSNKPPQLNRTPAAINVNKSAEVPQHCLNDLQPPTLPKHIPNLFSVPKPATPFHYSVQVSKQALDARKSDMKNLHKFDGTPKEWPAFLSQFKLSTATCEYQDVDNIVRLRECLVGKAKKAVQGALSLPENVAYIMETLEQLFGKPEFIINELIKEVQEFSQLKIDKYGEIIEFSLLVRNMTTTMKGAEMSNHLWNPNLLQELVMKLPIQLQREWAKFQLTMPSFNIESFSQWMQLKAQECVCLLTEPPSFGESRVKKGSVHLHKEQSYKQECVSCEGDCKEVSLCETFKKMSYNEKFSVVNDNNLCKKCLKKHRSPCIRKTACGIESCAYKHHPLLHKYADVNHHHHQSNCSMFKIIPITLHYNHKTFPTFALLDDGSSITLIESKFAKLMNLKGTSQPLCLKWTADTHRYEPESEQLSVRISGTNGKTFMLHDLHTVSSLNLPTQTVDFENLKDKHKHLRGIPFNSYKNAQPTILIGLNNVHLTLAHSTKVGSSNEPVAIKTQLGWVVFGNMNNGENSQEVYHICECECRANDFEEVLRDFIALDNLNINRPHQELLSKDDERSLAIMNDTTKFIGDRYETGLLWRYDNFKLPSSYAMALRRLKCLEKQMSKNPSLRSQMQEQIDEYVKNNYARELSTDERAIKRHWYLPLFVVRNPNKPSKIRMVWDAAATVDGVSLNSFLLKGPDQLTNLIGVLFRFRQFKIAIVGDIRHMFHQIRIKKEDQQFMRFLWSDIDGNIKVYVMEVMSFGPTCSPSSAQFVKNLNADLYQEKFPRAVQTIKENHYVDDMLESVDSESEANKLVDQVKFIHKSGGFEIRNFLSNSKAVMDHCNEENHKSKDVALPENNTEKVLGMWWNVSKDKFKYSLKFNKGNAAILDGSSIPTKREMLQVLMSVYDPLGLISHLLIFPKILMQEVWKSAIDWDDQISPELFVSWKEWVDSLHKIKKLKIPRWYGILENSKDIELHVFVDASLEAYAAAAYLRYDSGREVFCRLVSAKSKVAPLKPLSVPRLELNAAVIGARLATHIKKNHSIKFKSTTFWTDSKTVWCWMRSESRMYKPYVSYRVAEVLESSTVQQWNWLPTDLNIADVATRKKIHPISNRCEWFRGPKFLRKSSDHWPVQPSLKESTNEELRLHVLLHSTVLPLQVTNFSKWNRLRRSMAYVKRFVHNMLAVKNKWQKVRGGITEDESSEADQCAIQVMMDRRDGIFTSDEYQQAEIEIFKIAQWEGFGDEITAVKNNLQLEKSSPIKNCLPYLDDNGILRSKSRLDFMESCSEDFRRPILLPNNHYITKLLMQYYHDKFWHQLNESAINEINQRFLIPSIKAAFKKMRSQCQMCKNNAAKPIVPLMGNLHKSRLQVFTRAFTFIGIDYFGPLNVAVGRQRQKRWGALITCLTTRGVHIEISHSLSTESCIMSIKRFIARRGEPREIYSDQGTNFKGASRELKQELENLNDSKLAEEFINSNTQWFFNPPGAPHMGGAWERLVRCVKNALYAALPTKTPNEELLQTLMCQVEFVVNSRPLTTVPLETEDSEVLTPNHFLLGSSNGFKTFSTIPNDREHLLESWKLSNKFMSTLYMKFIKQYLPTIRRRTKDFNPMAKEIEVGDVVVILDDNFTRSMWKKGIVLDVYKSRDGHVRKATVQTQSGVFERAAAKLAVLDVIHKRGNPDSEEPMELPGGSVTTPASAN